MSRFVRVTILLAAITGLCATGSLANIPDPLLSEVPPMLSMSPTTLAQGLPPFTFTVVVVGQAGPVQNSFVELEISPAADLLLAYCVGQAHPIITGVTNASGEASFDVFGGGCVTTAGFQGPTFIWQVRADLVPLQEGQISSPDWVNSAGRSALDLGSPTCEDLGNGQWGIEVGVSDAVQHTPPLKRGLVSVCTDFAPDLNGNWGGQTGIEDAVAITPYLGNAGACVVTGSNMCP